MLQQLTQLTGLTATGASAQNALQSGIDDKIGGSAPKLADDGSQTGDSTVIVADASGSSGSSSGDYLDFSYFTSGSYNPIMGGPGGGGGSGA